MTSLLHCVANTGLTGKVRANQFLLSGDVVRYLHVLLSLSLELMLVDLCTTVRLFSVYYWERWLR